MTYPSASCLLSTNYISDQSSRYNNVIPLYFTQNSDTKNNFNCRKHNNNVTPPPPPKSFARPASLPFYFVHEKSMAQQSSRTENPRDFDHIQEDPSYRLSEEGNSNASDLVKSIFADPEALQLLRSAFINPLNSGASKAPHIEPEVQIIDARPGDQGPQDGTDK